ncbi:MAG: CHAT domain-containing protein [Cyclobacteriaceae bacterium]|nr:CHAT domain-containing protein [Cyclobacteriaceae bacterium]
MNRCNPLHPMRHTFLAGAFLLLSTLSATAQESYYLDLEKTVRTEYDRKNYEKASAAATELLRVYPDNLQVNVWQAASLMFLNKPSEARHYVDVALELDPSAPGPLTAKAYLLFLDGQADRARELLTSAIRFGPDDAQVKEATEEMAVLGKAFGKPSQFAALSNWLVQNEPLIKDRWLSLGKVVDGLNGMPKDPAAIRDAVVRFSGTFQELNRPDLALLTYFYGARHLSGAGFASEANALSLQGYTRLKAVGLEKYPAVSSLLMWQLIRFSNSKSDFEQTVQYAADFQAYMGKSVLPVYDTEAYQQVSTAFAQLRSGKPEQNQRLAQEYATKAITLATTHNYIFGIVSACNALTMSAYGAGDPQQLANAIYYGEQGYLLGDQYHLDLKDVILTNLALLYWNQGVDGRQKCLILYRNQIDKARRDGDLDRMSLLLNNLGSMYYATSDTDQAIVYFEESAALAGFGPEFHDIQDRLSHYQSQMSAYQWLVACYAKKGDVQKTFDAMERSRARVLSERLSHQATQTPVIADLQDLLKPDEACILYDVFSGYEVTLLVVTKKYAHVLFHVDDRFVGDIRDQYFNQNSSEEAATLSESGGNNRWFEVISTGYQRTQVYRGYDKNETAPREVYNRIGSLSRKFLEAPGMNDEFLNDVLSRYQKYLIVPILNKLNGIKTLIISPNDNLSFLPFEAFRAFDGKYLVEKYNIRYLHSASVLMQLSQRQYSGTRNPLLAMGGALYEDLDEKPLPLQTAADLSLLQAEVAENLREGKSQRKAYASLFGTKALNPLPGTLEEVRNISRNIEGATVFTGKDMSETRIKSMSKSGELARYKMVHLATHGFVVSEIPDLSGVAMSIASRPADGEDGFLNAVEVSNLRLNADITVLSACQTALGKLYVGEGVTGLTQSLLLAGSNAALVSLWPVSDTSTMRFMSDFYKEVSKGKPYAQVVNDIKRKFIKGDYGKEFQHPYYWAPFIYYGK